MKIAFTWDYELFFGEKSGTVQQCMLEPTTELLRLAEKHGAKFTFFPDAGYLVHAKKNEQTLSDLALVIEQIKHWDAKGHETGLHIHPHWEDVLFEENEWKHDTKRYKISDFSPAEINSIIHNYFNGIKEFVNSPIVSFRAGGWCAQPFSDFVSAFSELGISIDSSVFFKGKNTNAPYNYDYSNAPNKTSWRFESDLLVENEHGNFTELAISSFKYSPLFFWRLFLLGRWDPSRHKPIGNGVPASGGGSKKDLLTKYNTFCVSADGYFVSKLDQTLATAIREKKTHLLVIGHPKACTKYSLEKLDEFMVKYKQQVEFVTLSQLL